jgi:hypothetical protein
LAQLWYLDLLVLSFEKQRTQMILGKRSEIQKFGNLNFSKGSWFKGWFGNLKKQMAKLSYYDLLVIWWTKTL